MQNRFIYQFCQNNQNPYHICSQYCIQTYWPGNHPYRLKFCPISPQHLCNINCALKYGPKDQRAKLRPQDFPQIKDPKVRYLIYCLMYYGYNPSQSDPNHNSAYPNS